VGNRKELAVPIMKGARRRIRWLDAMRLLAAAGEKVTQRQTLHGRR